MVFSKTSWHTDNSYHSEPASHQSRLQEGRSTISSLGLRPFTRTALIFTVVQAASGATLTGNINNFMMALLLHQNIDFNRLLGTVNRIIWQHETHSIRYCCPSRCQRCHCERRMQRCQYHSRLLPFSEAAQLINQKQDNCARAVTGTARPSLFARLNDCANFQDATLYPTAT